MDPRELALADPNAAGPPPVASPPVPPAETNPASTTQVDLSPATSPADNPPAPPTKPLVLTASRDSFVRVTLLDAPGSQGVLYASVLRSGQSLAFDGHRFSVKVGVPSAVFITLDGVNYGPHSDRDSPETFTVESHEP